jgi:8-oxo-dGTP pyrophosphatase MutT (NUDIX family)
VRSRPPVVVYVTREHPQTAVDQLLVFDIVDKHAFQAVVPGGGIEDGETVEEAAKREALEETGIRVATVRKLAEDAGSHFVQAEPVGASPDEWEHVKTPGEELVRCRWVQVRPDLELWGERGALVHALIRRRVVAYVTRERDAHTELLTIEAEKYPEEGIQSQPAVSTTASRWKTAYSASWPRRPASRELASCENCPTSSPPTPTSARTTPSTS